MTAVSYATPPARASETREARKRGAGTATQGRELEMSAAPQPSAVIHVAGVEQANALLESLRRQGYSGDVIQAAGRWQIVVHSPREESSRLLVDLYDAIDRWLPDHTTRPKIEDL